MIFLALCLILGARTAVAVSPPFASSCAEYLERLGRTEEIASYLARHRSEVIARLAEDLVPSGQVDRETRVREVLMRRFAPEFPRWMDENGNGATVFHGAPSPSLMAFATERSLGLLPNRILIGDLGLVPLTGRFDGIDHNPWQLNHVGMNVVGLGEFDQTETYADPEPGFLPANYDALIDQYENDPWWDAQTYLAKLLRARRDVLNAPAGSCAWLIGEPFPVTYGFAPRPDALIWLAGGKLGPHTIVASNLSPQELRLVIVPAKVVERVTESMRRLNTPHPIKVVSQDSIAGVIGRGFHRIPCYGRYLSRSELRDMADDTFEEYLAVTLGALCR